MARMVCEVMNYFQWTQFALIVQSDLTGVSGGWMDDNFVELFYSFLLEGCLELSRDIDVVLISNAFSNYILFRPK